MKKKSTAKLPQNYASLLTTIKQRIQTAQVRTALAGNASMLMLYWDVGNLLVERQAEEGWGAAVLPRLAIDLRNELPEVKGFSVRNLMLMTQFAREYPGFYAIAQPPVAQLEDRTQDGSSKSSRSSKGQPSVAQFPAETTDAAIWQRLVAKSALDQRTQVGPACRAGLSSNARTVVERTCIQHRRVAPRSTSLNRRSRHVAKSFSARRTYRTQSMPAAKTNSRSRLPGGTFEQRSNCEGGCSLIIATLQLIQPAFRRRSSLRTLSP